MPPSHKQRAIALISAVAPCWAGEALVARRYFGSAHRTPERDIHWIGFQIFKEHTGGGVYGGPGETVASILQSASQRAAAITLSTPADQIGRILDDLTFAVDELRHMTQFMGLYALVGGDTHKSIESLGQLENARRLASLRHELRTTDIGRAAVDLSEGGGLGLQFGLQEYFRICPPVGAIDREIATLSQAVLDDETKHLLAKFAATATLDNSDRTWSKVSDRLVAISTQKLRERNEQFSSPLAEHDIAGIASNRALGQTYIDDHLGFLLAGR